MRVLMVGDSILGPGDLQCGQVNTIQFAGIATCDSEQFAADIAVRCSVDIVVAHQSLPHNGNGARLLNKIKTFNPQIYTVLLLGPQEQLDKDLGSGVDDFINKDYKQQIGVILAKNSKSGNADSQKPPIIPRQDQGAEDHKQVPLIRKTFTVLANIAFSLLIILMATMAFFMVQSKLAGGVPSLAGYQMYVVLSGSMQPAFDTGSLVFVKGLEPTDVQVNDIITFSGTSSSSMLTTHRVVKVNTVGGLSFVTRGDANNVNDPNPVQPEQLVGKVHGSVPHLGYLMGFAQTRQGLIFLVFIPGVLVIGYELYNIYKYTAKPKSNKTA